MEPEEGFERGKIAVLKIVQDVARFVLHPSFPFLRFTIVSLRSSVEVFHPISRLALTMPSRVMCVRSTVSCAVSSAEHARKKWVFVRNVRRNGVLSSTSTQRGESWSPGTKPTDKHTNIFEEKRSGRWINDTTATYIGLRTRAVGSGSNKMLGRKYGARCRADAFKRERRNACQAGVTMPAPSQTADPAQSREAEDG